MFRKPPCTLQTPDTLSRRSTCHNTLSINKTFRTNTRDTPVFSFTEVLESFDEPKNYKQQLPSLENLDHTISKIAKEDDDFSLKILKSETARVTHQEGPELIRAKSEISGRDVLDNTISTIHTLGDHRSTPGRLHDDKEEIVVISEYRKTPQHPRPVRMIKTNVEELLSKCKLLTSDVGRINKNALKTEAAYFKTLDELDEKLKEPVHKFEFWKVDKKFVKQRAQIKNQVKKFRQVHIEAKKEQDKLHELDHYRQKPCWGDEKEENENLTSIEKMILKKPKPFRIKRMLTKEDQFELRPKAFDINLATEPDLLCSTKEKTEVEEILDNLNKLKPLIFGEKDSDKQQTAGEMEVSASSSSEEGQKEFCSNQVYYFADIKNIKGHKGNVSKNQPKRVCRPIANGDGAVGAMSFRSSFTAFKKSNMALRSQRG